MCRSDIDRNAEAALAVLLTQLAAAIAHRDGVDPRDVRIGPVDFGSEDVSAGLGGHDQPALLAGLE